MPDKPDKITDKIMNVKFAANTMQETLEILLGFLRTDRAHLVCTPNPEALMLARRDEEFLRILQQAELVLPDSVGIFLAAKILGIAMPCRVPGCDITQRLLEKIGARHTVYLLGAAPGVAEQAALRLKECYGIVAVGFRDGFFGEEDEPYIIEEIKSSKPDILLIGMGMPRQEKFARKYQNELPCKIILCVGGSLDIMAGTVKRAPKIMRRFGLEWLYRLASQPSRAKRMLALPKFALLILCEKCCDFFQSKKFGQ